MPLITIQSLPPADPNVIPQMITRIRDSAAKALKSSPLNIWVMFQALTPGHYVQGPENATLPRKKSHPPIVIIRAQTGRTLEERSVFVNSVANTIGEALSIPVGNVWIHYQEMNPQDVWFNGKWSN